MHTLVCMCARTMAEPFHMRSCCERNHLGSRSISFFFVFLHLNYILSVSNEFIHSGEVVSIGGEDIFFVSNIIIHLVYQNGKNMLY